MPAQAARGGSGQRRTATKTEGGAQGVDQAARRRHVPLRGQPPICALLSQTTPTTRSHRLPPPPPPTRSAVRRAARPAPRRRPGSPAAGCARRPRVTGARSAPTTPSSTSPPPPGPDLFVNPDEISYPGGGAGPTVNEFGACKATWRVVDGVGEWSMPAAAAADFCMAAGSAHEYFRRPPRSSRRSARRQAPWRQASISTHTGTDIITGLITHTGKRHITHAFEHQHSSPCRHSENTTSNIRSTVRSRKAWLRHRKEHVQGRAAC
jgi:hypothetical protein